MGYDIEKEKREAIEAGRRALNSLQTAKENLNSAKNWGLADMFGGGFFTTMLKHSKMDQAKRNMEQAKYDLRNFSRELNDVNMVCNLNIDTGDFLSFADYFFDGFIPRITWTLYNADNSVKAYEHFDIPMLMAVDKVYSRIRNVKYRYIAGQQTLFPDEVDQYEPELIKEIINNCIAHQDYRLRGKINVEEFEDRLVFINEGAFIPETIEQALEPGYKPPYYRNVFLCNAMVNLYMIDTNSMGIPMMYQIQRDKCFPLPTYDLNTINRVTVTVYGKILDKNYTQLLYSNEDLDMRTVFLLDKVQKQEVVSKESFKDLKKKGLVEGRYPNVFVSFKVADIVGQKAAYVRNKGLDDDICKQLIIKALQSMGEASKRDLMEVLEKALPEVLRDEQKSKKVSNLLQAMKKDGIVVTTGTNRYAKWYLIKK